MSEVSPVGDIAKYSTGENALFLNGDGSGFAYYPSGRVAACISTVNSYQKRFNFFENDRHKTLLCSVDEKIVGFAQGVSGRKLVMTGGATGGGLLTDDDDRVIRSWKWDAQRQNAGKPPTEPVVLTLNNSLTFTFGNRENIKVVFSDSGYTREFDCGEKLRRTDSYLSSSAKRVPGAPKGKLFPDTSNFPSLKDRQLQFNKDMKMKQAKNRPKASHFKKGDISSIVQGLEDHFDTYSATHKATPWNETGWKEAAKQMTMGEVPPLPYTGMESGTMPKASLIKYTGMPRSAGDSSNQKQEEEARLSQTAPAGATGGMDYTRRGSDEFHPLQNDKGQWLGSLEVKEKLLDANPELAKSAVLCGASGRYYFARDQLGRSNKQKHPGAKLPVVKASNFDRVVKGAADGQLLVIGCLRDDDHQCRMAEIVMQQVQSKVEEGAMDALVGATASSSASSGAGAAAGAAPSSMAFQLMKFNVTESRYLIDRYNVQTVPFFLMYHNGNLVHATTLGGNKMRVKPTTKNAHLTNAMDDLPRVLLVEPNFKHQLQMEKVLKRELFQWELAMTGQEAVKAIKTLADTGAQQVSGKRTRPEYGLVLMSDQLPDDDIKAIERMVTRGSAGVGQQARVGGRARSTTLMLALSENKGRNGQPAAPHRHGVIAKADAHRCLRPIVEQVVAGAIAKPLKALSLHHWAKAWYAGSAANSALRQTANAPRRRPGATARMAASMTAGAKPATTSDGTTKAEEENESWKGMTKEHLMSVMLSAREDGRRNRTLPANFRFPLSLACEETKSHGVALRKL